MTSIANIVDAISNPFTAWRTLRGVEPLMVDGRPKYVVGNAAVTFTIRHDSQTKILKCYTRTHPNLQAIYGESFLKRELCVVDLTGRSEWVDCLVIPLIEGRTLDEAIREASSPYELRQLALAFENLARELLAGERAHGDLKPENIIVSTDNSTMKAIDWDAAYLPQFKGQKAVETGTAAYQHPARSTEMFDKHIDDYSIAVIYTLLHAAAIDNHTAEYYRQNFEPEFLPKLITGRRRESINRIIDLFAAKAMAAQYRIARMLTSPTAQLFDLQRILQISAAARLHHNPTSSEQTQSLYLENENGLWGYRNDKEWIIAPLFDKGFEPTDSTMLVGLGRYQHFIGLDSRRLASFDEKAIVKPFRSGVTTIILSNGTTYELQAKELLHNSID